MAKKRRKLYTPRDPWRERGTVTEERHVSNFLSAEEARRSIEGGVKRVSFTPTALRQTSEGTLGLLRAAGVEIRCVQRRGRPRRLTDEEGRKVLAIRRAEPWMSFTKIGDLLGIPKSTVFDTFLRYQGETVREEEVRELQVSEGKRLLRTLLAEDLDEEINRLALRGYCSEDPEEIREILEDLHGRINGQ
jgi:hypothetical protein